MKKNRFNQKSIEFADNQKAASEQIEKATGSIFFWRKNLISLSVKNGYCNGKSVAVVEKAVRNYTKGGQKWDVNIFVKDFCGRFCLVAKYTEKAVSLTDLQHGDIITDSKGREIIVSNNDTLAILKPIAMNLKAVFNAFCSVAAKEIKAIEKAEKDAICAEEKAEKDRIKAIEKAEKIRVRKLNELQKKHEKGQISTLEYINKCNELKAA